uniref:NADH-ubiquinone oxidoreductase chain 4 n=1 Tax=Scirtothrips dorsalis TaxID=163899 RepID=A0A089N8R0_SCIDO|nr:NADH dehydrogenase subunit 4 [Scirtothrips dorsalis]AIQ81004.1 NADH dehydrogenase subunit 4 [Scirtothrips dorsalis]
MFFFLFLLFFLNSFFLIHWSYFVLFLMLMTPFLFFMNFSNFFMSKYMYICLDLYSFQMLILTILIVCFCLISSIKILKSPTSEFFKLNFFFLTFLIMLYFSLNTFFFFFFFFESTLLPTLYIILGWGNNIERVQSGLYLFFYTLFGSMPMMMGIFYLASLNKTLCFNFMEMNSFFFLLNLVFVFSFLIKMPMFLFHSWLPKAHVEAPVSGSMILAGVLLKMGGYGIYRVIYIFKFFQLFNSLWIYISVWGGILTSLICIRQVDLKCLVAYSSVSHMAMVIMGFFVFSKLSMMSCFMLMVAHGLCSSGLFYLINVVYERSGSRSLFLNKGLMSVFPSLSMWWFILCSFNMASPPSLNLMSEIFLICSSFSWSFMLISFMMILCFLSAVYNLFLFTSCNHGKLNSNLNYFNSCYLSEFFNLFLHILPVFLMFLKLELYF